MSHAERVIRLGTYRSTSKAALGVAFALAPAATADVLDFNLDQTFTIAQSGQQFMTITGSGLEQASGGGATFGSFTASIEFLWAGSRLYIGFGPQSLPSANEIYFRTFGAGLYTVAGGETIGGSDTGRDMTAGTIYPGAETGVFYMGIHVGNGGGEIWHGYLTMDQVSATEIRIDHWAMESRSGVAIGTPPPSSGDAVPAVGGIAALALGASGVRRSRRRLV